MEPDERRSALSALRASAQYSALTPRSSSTMTSLSQPRLSTERRRGGPPNRYSAARIPTTPRKSAAVLRATVDKDHPQRKRPRGTTSAQVCRPKIEEYNYDEQSFKSTSSSLLQSPVCLGIRYEDDKAHSPFILQNDPSTEYLVPPFRDFTSRSIQSVSESYPMPERKIKASIPESTDSEEVVLGPRLAEITARLTEKMAASNATCGVLREQLRKAERKNVEASIYIENVENERSSFKDAAEAEICRLKSELYAEQERHSVDCVQKEVDRKWLNEQKESLLKLRREITANGAAVAADNANKDEKIASLEEKVQALVELHKIQQATLEELQAKTDGSDKLNSLERSIDVTPQLSEEFSVEDRLEQDEDEHDEDETLSPCFGFSPSENEYIEDDFKKDDYEKDENDDFIQEEPVLKRPSLEDKTLTNRIAAARMAAARFSPPKEREGEGSMAQFWARELETKEQTIQQLLSVIQARLPTERKTNHQSLPALRENTWSSQSPLSILQDAHPDFLTPLTKSRSAMSPPSVSRNMMSPPSVSSPRITPSSPRIRLASEATTPDSPPRNSTGRLFRHQDSTVGSPRGSPQIPPSQILTVGSPSGSPQIPPSKILAVSSPRGSPQIPPSKILTVGSPIGSPRVPPFIISPRVSTGLTPRHVPNPREITSLTPRHMANCVPNPANSLPTHPSKFSVNSPLPTSNPPDMRRRSFFKPLDGGSLWKGGIRPTSLLTPRLSLGRNVPGQLDTTPQSPRPRIISFVPWMQPTTPRFSPT